MTFFEKTVSEIVAVNDDLRSHIQHHLDDLTKPPGSLGALEELAMRFCLITNTNKPVLAKKRIVTFAADHGVAAEGVSAFPQEVTPQMVMNMLFGGAAVNVLGAHTGTEVKVVDIGVAAELENAPGLIRKKVRQGTANMAKGPAMTEGEALEALEIGIAMAASADEDGVDILGTGEMGIANTTAASALFSALLPCPVFEITGRGTGINDETLQHKIKVIENALATNKALLNTPLGALRAVGGLEIAGIAGLILGAAARRIPIVVDGFISSAGALVACRIKPEVKDFLIFSHMSSEAGHKRFYEGFGVKPLLDLGMRLGEGTGAALVINLVEASCRIYNEMATFSSAGVSDGS